MTEHRRTAAPRYGARPTESRRRWPPRPVRASRTTTYRLRTAAALYFGEVFFPEHDPVVGTLLSFATWPWAS